MNAANLNLLDKVARAYLFAGTPQFGPLLSILQLRRKNTKDTKAYDILVQNCQEFAKRLKVRICLPSIETDKRKRRVVKKVGRALRFIFVDSGRGFTKLGTGLFKRALISSLSNPQFIQPGAGR